MKNEKVIQLGGKSYIKARPVQLPAKEAKEAKIFIMPYTHNLSTQFVSNCTPQHLYFLSEEEIKEGDWAILFDSFGKVFGTPQQYLGQKAGHHLNKGLKKIIATTDESLSGEEPKKYVSAGGHYQESTFWRDWNKNKFPRPSNEFLQAYCNANGKIEEVLVEVELQRNSTKEDWIYKLKLSPDNTITTKRVEERMHSNAEVRELFIKAAKSNLFEGGWKTDLSIKILDKWISENL